MNRWSHPVLATLSSCYPKLRGRSPTCYSAVRHSLQSLRTEVRSTCMFYARRQRLSWARIKLSDKTKDRPYGAVTSSFEFDPKNRRVRAVRSCHSSAVKDRALCLPCGTGHGRDVSGNRTNSTGDQSTTGLSSADRPGLEAPPTFQSPTDCHLIRPFKIAAHGETAGKSSDSHSVS